MDRINALIRQLSACQKNKDGGAEGMARRKEEAVEILTEIVSLTPLPFYRHQLLQAKADLIRASYLRSVHDERRNAVKERNPETP